ncbi:MAG TPA: S-methyl-5-thioribose-1-phosphate isomerase [Tenuifilaceae bacterium]|nr:S-methyl-5-thioribose-1-phosphate isomerase [Bacteroidales bacterium]HOA10027.1 S-methyl-5-thioribose-1-phosphate isomerase [Tenuifilaceae bacterium]NLI87405.1 S-methyl-5-thioribose-1-phosphate isomerase [Bacteroidales bacterium]HOC35521.1 S-methyl-5-thioribose-1-phosphate isomerase [Tenuifilaceae bacterium]HOG71552.1 S-methyl-5-thioribose-1-phosphate isomerase [Tenuifilaceae bacterium]
MKVNGVNYRTIWLEDGSSPCVKIIDQRYLPHRFVVEPIESFDGLLRAISEMHLRGAGLIGVAAAFGIYLAVWEQRNLVNFQEALEKCALKLIKTRPTAVNLRWAVERQLEVLAGVENPDDRVAIARQTAIDIAEDDAGCCRKIGLEGVGLIEDIARNKNGGVVNILTHCNAGWLAFTDYGSALAPVYEAWRRGVRLHVWVDETRPRNQGASLTAWELLNEGITHTVIADNTGGHLMQHGLVDLVLTGADRITTNGDAANKIGTYLKALAAHDNGVPFYIAAPSSTFDWSLSDGLSQIPIEQRHPDEVRYVGGWLDGRLQNVLVCPDESPAANFAFDVTPARLISGIITERGICKPLPAGIKKVFPEKFNY